jgi:hypothetical protein
MKVIQSGKKWDMERTCCACSALLEIEKEDIRTKLDKTNWKAFFICPECHVETEIPSDCIPLPIWKNIVEERKRESY